MTLQLCHRSIPPRCTPDSAKNGILGLFLQVLDLTNIFSFFKSEVHSLLHYAPPSPHLIAALVLLNGGVTVGALLSLVGQVVLTRQVGGHVRQLLLPVPGAGEAGHSLLRS